MREIMTKDPDFSDELSKFFSGGAGAISRVDTLTKLMKAAGEELTSEKILKPITLTDKFGPSTMKVTTEPGEEEPIEGTGGEVSVDDPTMQESIVRKLIPIIKRQLQRLKDG